MFVDIGGNVKAATSDLQSIGLDGKDRLEVHRETLLHVTGFRTFSKGLSQPDRDAGKRPPTIFGIRKNVNDRELSHQPW